MDNRSLLECKQTFRDHLKEFIEIFVDYYGEDQRLFIEERFSSAILVGYVNEFAFEQALKGVELEESVKLYKELLSKSKLNATMFQLFGKKLFGEECNSITDASSHPINQYKTYYEEFALGEEGRENKYYKSRFTMLRNFAKDITFEEYMEMVKTGQVPEKYSHISDRAKDIMLGHTDISYYKKSYEESKEKAVEFLKSIYPDLDVTVQNLEELTPTFTDLNETLVDYEKMLERFEEVKGQYSKYYKIIEENKALRSNLHDKYYRKYLQEVTEFLPEQLKGKIQEYLDSQDKYASLDYKIRDLLGSSFDNSPSISAFSKDATDRLESSDTTDWEKGNIKSDRIKYFKALGIDLGDDYESYVGLPEWPSQEQIEAILTARENCSSDFNREYYTNMYPQRENIEEMRARGFLDIDPNEFAEMYMENSGMGITCVNPNLIMNEQGQYEIAAKLAVSFSGLDPKTRDHMIIHEFNHLYELALSRVVGGDYEVICGWDQIYGKIHSSEEGNIQLNRPKRSYELFNEIINEKIAKDISERMVRRGQAIFGEATEESYRNVTGYDSTNYLVKTFFETYKKEILESRKGGNIQVIFDAVGKENFDALNELFAIHNEHFAGFNYYSLLDDVKAKRETERTRIAAELMKKRDEILSKMQEHYRVYSLKGKTSETPALPGDSLDEQDGDGR